MEMLLDIGPLTPNRSNILQLSVTFVGELKNIEADGEPQYHI